MISYARHWEDVLLARVFPPAHQGFFVDVGAGDPVAGSLTKLFSDRGWTGVNVEPAAAASARLRAGRDRDVNLAVAVADHEGPATLYEFGGRATLSTDRAERQRAAGADVAEREVEVTTLAKVFESHAEGRPVVDVLAVRAGGQEREILDGGDWQRWRPRLVVVEVERAGGHEAWEKVLIDGGYEFAASTGGSRIYVRSEDRDLAAALAVPVNPADDFVPWPLAQRLQEAESLRRDLAAARAANDALRAVQAGIREVDALRAQTANLDAAAAAIQAQCDEARALMADSLTRYEMLRRDVIQTRIEVEAAQSVFRSVGPAGLAVAQRLARASLRFPAAGSVAKRSARVVGWVKRTLRSG